MILYMNTNVYVMLILYININQYIKDLYVILI